MTKPNVMWLKVSMDFSTSRPYAQIPGMMNGAVGPFDGAFAWGGIGNWNPRTSKWTYLGGFVDGGLEIDRASLAAGGAVSGRFRARVIQW